MEDHYKPKRKRGERRRTRNIVVVIGVVLLAIIALGALIFWAVTSWQEIGEVSNDFMVALKDGVYADADSLFTDRLQQQIGGSDGLRELVENNNWHFTDWSFTSFQVRNSVGTVNGNATFADRQISLLISLWHDGENWKITGFDFGN